MASRVQAAAAEYKAACVALEDARKREHELYEQLEAARDASGLADSRTHKAQYALFDAARESQLALLAHVIN